MKSIKRIPVCFNTKNESQKELLDKLNAKFSTNLSGGIKQILWSYFFGGGDSDRINKNRD